MRKVQGLGGKFGEKICEDLGIQFMGDLIRFSKEELQRRYDERNGHWLFNIARGIDLEAVTPRLVSKSIGCCKKFPGRNAILAMTTLNHWLNELAKEITERLEQDEMENNRRPKQMVVSFVQSINNADVSSSRTMNLTTLDTDKIVNDALDVLKKNTDKFYKSADNNTVLNNPIKFLGLNVGKFESLDVKKGNTIQGMFQRTIENKKNETKIEASDEAKDDESDTNGEESEVEEIKDETTETKNESKANSDSNDKTEEKKDDSKQSFFANYHRMQQQKKAEAEAEAARKAEEERKRNEENQCVDDAESDEENRFQNDMLLDELEQSNRSVSVTTRSESPMPSTSKGEYMQTYAEFYVPPEIEVPKVECTQCGKKVNAHDIQIHTDEHFAFQLTQEQRVEFQSQLKRSISTTTPAAKKQKTATNAKTKSPPKIASIQKFLVKPGQEPVTAGPSTSTASDVETEKCAECGKNIPIVDLFEHMDFHAAKKLHDELMKAETAANRTNNNTISSNTGKNRSTSKTKKTNKKATTNATPTAMKNISSFFQNS